MSYKHLFFLVCGITISNTYAQESTCPGIQRPDREQPKQLLFTYPSDTKASKAHYYAKALTDQALTIPTPQDILQKGVDLTPVPDTSPQLYQIPENASKLYILQSTKALADAGIGSKIQLTDKSRPKRNTSIFVNDLQPETALRTVENSTEQLKLCELAL